jgi:LAO/AO transport system kinase
MHTISKPSIRRNRLSAKQYIDGILSRDRTILARSITLIESDLASDQDLASDVIEGCLPHSGRSRRIGITGVPGAGKSTLLEALGCFLTNQRRETVAVLAVDPSSPISRGSILGDKTRMERLATSALAFIRPSPSRGHLGGVAHRTREAMLLCEAAGYGNIFVETVGVGQSETAVRSMVDSLVLIVLAGAGDELQCIKRGILEMADMIAVNKADGDNTERAGRARNDYATVLHLWPAGNDGWAPPVTTCSAVTHKGIDTLWQMILDHRAHAEKTGWLERQRSEQALEWMRNALLHGIEEDFRSQAGCGLEQLQQDVLKGRISPFRAARTLLARFRSGA